MSLKTYGRILSPFDLQTKALKAKSNALYAEKILDRAYVILVGAIVLLFFASSWMAESWFNYQVTSVKTEEVPYEYVVEKVRTYIAYTTTYGECYHAESCGYLHSSKHKTTVYEAEQNGYRKCSRCTPKKGTTFEITETRYKTVQHDVTETVDTTWTVFFSGTGSFCLLYFFITKPIRKKRDASWAEYRKITGERIELERSLSVYERGL